MPSEIRFSEVSVIYNTHIANLNHAREMFEEEVRGLNELILEHLGDTAGRPRDGVVKLRWSAPEDRSKSRDVAWLNFRSGSRLRLDVRPPGFSRFKRGAAFLHFEIVFDPESSQFLFRSRLENQNTVSDEIDERVVGVVETRGKDIFPRHCHLKRNTAIVFCRDLNDSIFENLNQYIDDAINVVEAAVEGLFPDSAYADDNTGEDSADPAASNDDDDADE